MERKLDLYVEEMKLHMEESEFFLESEKIIRPIMLEIDQINQKLSEECGRPVVEYMKWRIKTSESIVKKLYRKQRKPTFESAVKNINDMIGIRIICSFQDDVYKMTKEIRKIPEMKIKKVKDYIAHPKSSGYRSIHIIIELPYNEDQTIGLEIQVRSAAMNYWATLDHQLSYKHKLGDPKETEKIRKELKSYAMDIAEIDKKFLKLRKKIDKL